DVDVELVRPIGHEDEQHAAAVLGVAHELLDAPDDARAGAAVAVPVGAAEGAVAFVDDHDDLADGLDDRQDALQVAFSGTHPLAAKVLELDGGEPALLGERLGDERFPGPHRTSKQYAHWNAITSSFADIFRHQ